MRVKCQSIHTVFGITIANSFRLVKASAATHLKMKMSLQSANELIGFTTDF